MKKFDVVLNKEMIVEEMSNRGLKCTLSTAVKNGVNLTALIYQCGTVCPIIYLEDFEGRFDSFEEMCDKIEDLFRAHETEGDEVNFSSVLTEDYFRRNVIPCVQKRRDTEEDIITRDAPYFDDLEKYYRVRIYSDKMGEVSFKVSEKHLEQVGITVDTLDKYAMQNLKESTEYRDLTDVLQAMGSELIQYMLDAIEDDGPKIVVASNHEMCNGSACILDNDMMESVCETLGTTELTIIPSSIHEVIILPRTGFDSDSIDEWIREINKTFLDSKEILSDHSYEWSLIA